jgi:gluconate:H+ symporter, GntP family
MIMLIFLTIIVLFAVLNFRFQWPVGLALAVSAAVGGLLSGVSPLPLAGGDGLLRHMVEGAFVYIDPMLIMATAIFFMNCVEESGLLGTLSMLILRGLGKRPALLAILMAAFVAFPGLLTGLTTASVLTTGAIAAPPMIRMGMDKRRVGAFIAIAAILGMIAPPVNLPVMIIGGGVDMPYLGFTIPLLILSLPMLIICSLLIAWKPLKNGDPDAALIGLDSEAWKAHGLKLFLPLLLVLALMIAPRIWPGNFPSLGLPLIFILGSLLALFSGKGVNLQRAAAKASRQALPVMGILVGVGCFIQVMTLTGMRGELVVSCLELPEWLIYLGILISMPAFGAVSAFGSASVLGVPFLLALLGNPEIWVGSGLSLMAALGDLMPPTALSGIFAAQVVGEKNYFKVLVYCLIPAALMAAWGLILVIFSPQLAALLTSITG